VALMNSNTDLLPGDRDVYDDEIDLKPYLLALWRYRLAIVVVTLLSGVAAFFISRSNAPTFEARTQLIVTPPKVGEDSGAAVNVATFRALLDNQTLASQVMADMGLGKPPYALTPSRFLGQLTIEAVPGTSILAVSARMSDATLAAHVVNQFASRAVEMARRLNEDESVTTRDIMRGQLDQARKRFDQAEAALANYKKEAQVDLVREDVHTLLGQRGALIRLLVDIEGEKARLASTEHELAKQERVRTAPTATNVGALLGDAARESRAADEARRQDLARPPSRDESKKPERPPRRTEPQRADTQGLVPVPEFRGDSLNPFINPVYEMLNQQIAMSTTRLAALERQRAELANTLKLNAPQLAQLTVLYKHETEIARLETEYDLAKKIYLEVATRYEQAEIQVVGRSAQLQILDQAFPPDWPIAPRPRRTAAFALLGGFLVSVLAVIAVAVIGKGLRGRAARRPREGPSEATAAVRARQSITFTLEF
jgi:uncharacterized protein involved in exopolysaccharide biosynthesis